MRLLKKLWCTIREHWFTRGLDFKSLAQQVCPNEQTWQYERLDAKRLGDVLFFTSRLLKAVMRDDIASVKLATRSFKKISKIFLPTVNSRTLILVIDEQGDMLHPEEYGYWPEDDGMMVQLNNGAHSGTVIGFKSDD